MNGIENNRRHKRKKNENKRSDVRLKR